MFGNRIGLSRKPIYLINERISRMCNISERFANLVASFKLIASHRYDLLQSIFFSLEIRALLLCNATMSYVDRSSFPTPHV